jgi:predicted RNA-binding Zn-ribbon protein involved in translation (DUF1610 family)
MGVKVKGNMYCDACQRPVAGQKSTHRLRNTAAVITAPVTGGASMAGAASGKWHCPNCGGPVKTIREKEGAEWWAAMDFAEKAWTVGIILVLLILLGALGSLLGLGE